MIYYFETKSTNPFYNLAFEEFFFDKKKDGETYVMLWQNDNTVVIGKHQNIYEEIDFDYAQSNNINIVRRNSGGGSVYHDLGNYNYSLMFDYNFDYSIEKFSQPIINLLSTLGLNARFQGRNDIYIDDFKVSGTAQHIKENKILHHGTLLVNSDLSKISKVLTRNTKILSSSAVPSKKAQICNIQNLTDTKIDFSMIKNAIIKQYPEIQEYTPSETELVEINKLRQKKYKSQDWLIGKNLKYEYKNKMHFEGGTIEVSANIKNNIIKEIKFYGDFFTIKDLSELESSLIGTTITDNLYKSIKELNAASYFKNISNENIYSLFEVFTKKIKI